MRISLFHTSDEHGHLEGAPAIQKQVDASRADHPTLLVSTGDVFEGSATSTLLGAQPSMDVLKAAGYDLMALGNHDFDRGSEFTREWVAGAPCPVLAANVEEASGGLLKGVKPYLVVEMGGVKVGFIGVTTQETAMVAYGDALKDVRFTDPIAAVKKYAAELRSQGVPVVGVASHLGLAVDRELAQSVSGLDFILGGHTHDRTDSGQVVNGTVIGHPGCFRSGVGRLDLDLENGRVVSASYQAVPVSGSSADGPVGEIVARYEKEMEAPLSQQIARLTRPFVHDDVEDDDMEEVVTRAMQETSGADVAMINQKFMRTSLHAGVLSRRDTLTAMPFDNRVYSVKMKASEVARILTESARRNDQTSLAMHGIHFQRYADGSYTMLRDGEPLMPDAELTVAMTDYLLSGGLEYLHQDLRSQARDHGLVREVVEKKLADPSFVDRSKSSGTLPLQFHEGNA